jgi:hypothetical protein
MDAVADRLLSKLRQLAPHKVRVYDNSDDHRDVAVPNRRKRWSQVIETIEGRPWVKCELLDKSGAILGYVENDGAAGDVEELGGGGTGGSVQQRWFLEMMIKAQTVALTYRDKEHAALLEGMREMMAVQTQSIRELIALFSIQRDVASDIAAMKAAAEAGSDMDQIIKLIEASPQLMQSVGPLLQLLFRRALPGPKATKGAPATPPNGAKS